MNLNRIDPQEAWDLVKEWRDRAHLLRTAAEGRKVTLPAVADACAALMLDRAADELSATLVRCGKKGERAP